jgi:hypothetical protein
MDPSPAHGSLWVRSLTKSGFWITTHQLVTYLITKDYVYFIDGKETSDVDYIVDSMIEGRKVNCIVPK